VAIVNAFYNGNENSFQFPAGVLQGAFFNHLVPKYLNFGGIGTVIGHEITHGFDDKGRQFDAEGELLLVLLLLAADHHCCLLLTTTAVCY
jgi:predicted metalloendopeptidase